MAEFLAQKAVRDRDRLLGGRSPPSPMDFVAEQDDDDEGDEGEELVDMAEFLAQKAVRDRDQWMEERPPPLPSSPPTKLVADEGEDDRDEEELVGRAGFMARKGQRERRMEERQSPSRSSTQPGAAPAVDLGMDGGIFPSDVFPGSASDEITLQGAKLEPGQPEALVGFWKVCWAACSSKVCSARTS